MKIIIEYKNILKEINITELQLTRANVKLKKELYKYGPKNNVVSDYNKVYSNNYYEKNNIVEVANSICDIQKEITLLKSCLNMLYLQKEKCEEYISSLGDVKKKILMLKIKGYTHMEVAYELNYSKRRIEQLYSEIKKEFGEISV